jgi:MFS family permease
MSRTPRLWHSTDSAPPDARSRHRRETGQVLGIVLGGLIGFAVGIVIVAVWHTSRSGSWRDISVYLFGFPWLLLIGGAVVGGLLATTPEVEEVDAPVRDRRAVETGEPGASTDERGQTPGSPVQPAYRPQRPGHAQPGDAARRPR